MNENSNRLGGGYSTPVAHFSDDYTRADFHNAEDWKAICCSFGDIVACFDHISKPALPIKGGKPTVRDYCAPVYLARDGLVATEIPAFAQSDEDALIVLSHQINSFLSALNFGGVNQAPLAEKQIAHVTKDDNKISQVSGGGDDYSQVTLTRALHRFQPPLIHNSHLIDHAWAPNRIYNVSHLRSAYVKGSKILKCLDLTAHETIISLEAYNYYTVHKWSSAVLLGWSFTEILIDRVWNKHIAQSTNEDEKGRRDRLKDHRVYSAAVKTEILYTNSFLNLELYNSLNRLRGIRNGLIHEARPVFQQDARLIFETIPELINVLTGEASKFSDPGWSRSGGWIA